MDKKYVINIGRQFGAGGLEIAEKLSRKLGINYYDKNFIEIAAKKSGLDKELFEKSDEKPPAGILGNLSCFLTNAVSCGYYGENFLLNDSVFKIQSDIIRQLARKESCIFVGRCADYVLREHPFRIDVFVCADIEDRIKNILSRQKEEIKNIRKEVENIDKHRAKYYNFYSGKVWGAASSYHLCVNSSVLGMDETTECIYSFAAKKFGLQTF
ncbi:MAG: cytidylate kinase-like family protein [Endomicrobia bacterium]|nr:cytidylate kinase-like family protein [Endomicrobiia bacterium]